MKKTILLFFVFLSLSLLAQENKKNVSDLSIDELNRQLENPLSRFWSLIFQENLVLNNGDLVDDYITTNVFNFQPSLPVPVGTGKMLLVRPVFPLVTSPEITESGTFGDQVTGLGDMQVFSLYGPDKKGGLIWGAGLTFVFPTASNESLGNGKYQAGPALMLLSLSPTWNYGTIIQHWNSYAGDPNRPEVTKTDIQYILRRQIKGKGMSIGMGPNVVIDWNAPEGNRLTLPIGLGVTKTVKWGKTPWKLRVEPQYSIIRPDDFGSVWNLRIQFAPIINNPFF